jgi:hypothetical protein
MKLSLVTDQALGEPGSDRKDGLGFEGYAEILSAVAQETPGPFTIGILGEWGTGKTSLMHLIEQRLRANGNVVAVWFNAWRYEQETHPMIPLAGSTIKDLREDRPRSSAATARSIADALRAFAYGFSGSLSVPGVSGLGVSFSAKDAIDRRERLRSDPLLDRSLYYGAFSKLERANEGGKIRIVVFIDDLDRCLPENAVKLLESIKLALAQPGFIFILGIARKIVEGYLDHLYAGYGIEDFDGRLYLDKIIQLPFSIPSSANHIAGFCARLLDGQEPDIREEIGSVLPLIAVAIGANPRAVIRLLNNVLVDAAAGSGLAAQAADGPFTIAHFAITRCLEFGWAELLSQLLSDETLAASASKWQLADLPALAAADDAVGRLAAILLSDRALRDVMFCPDGREWLAHLRFRSGSIELLRQQRRMTMSDISQPAALYDTFVSYSRADRFSALKIIDGLSARGLRLFSDNQLMPGDDWSQVLASSLLRSRDLCVLAGQTPIIDGYMNQELQAAVARSDIRIIPILLPGVDIAELPPPLAERQWLDMRDGITDTLLDELTGAIKAK